METMYEAPKVYTLGAVDQMTQADDMADKCGGSGDAFKPLENILSNTYSYDCP